MGRKASFRDTTQIDRPAATLSFYRNVINVRFYGHIGFLPQARECFSQGANAALTPFAALLKSVDPVTLSVIAPIMIHYYTTFYTCCQYFFGKNSDEKFR